MTLVSRIDNEIEKVLVNLGDRKNIPKMDKYVKVSKEYNTFELQSAVGAKGSCQSHPYHCLFLRPTKSCTHSTGIATLYNLFSKTYMIFGQDARDEKV